MKTRLPRIYAAAIAKGHALERDRNTSHLVMGEKVGDIRLAIKAIRDGSELAELMPSYLQVGRNRADIRARIEDDDVVQAALEGIAPTPSSFEDPFERQVLHRFEQLLRRTDVGGAAIEDLPMRP